MFNVTIIKLKDIIKIGVILILIYVFSNFIFKTIKTKSLLNYSLKFDSVDFVKKGIEKEISIINNILKDQNTGNIIIESEEKNKNLFDIKSILNIGANIFSLKQKENKDGQDRDKEGDKQNRYRKTWYRKTWYRCTQRRGQKEPVPMYPTKQK